MKRIFQVKSKMKGLSDAVLRYPVTALFLFAVAVLISISSHTDKDLEPYILTCVIGAVLCAALQSLYEHFFDQPFKRTLLLAGGLVITVAYFFWINSSPVLSEETSIRTWIIFTILFVAFVWIPSIRSRVDFNQTFMTVFKAVFHSLFYAVVIFLGCSMILAAINALIFQISEKAYMDAADIIFVLFSPLYFLSMIPYYPKRQTDDAGNCPKFLEVLLSYIIVPLVEIFTVILFIYIVINIRGKFWTDNLLEPMLISYAITVILVYILCSRLENKFATWYRTIMPKILIPIALFQLVSSVIVVRETGVTDARYFVIAFGMYAVLGGIFMSFLTVRKNGILATILMVFLIVAILPPIDAFTVSRVSQENRLKDVLMQNKMLENNEIKANSNLSKKDKQTIISSVEYLESMNELDHISWMPKDFSSYEDFYKTFGFYEYEIPNKNDQNIYVSLKTGEMIPVAEYEYFLPLSVNNSDTSAMTIGEINKQGKRYQLMVEKNTEGQYLSLIDENKNDILHFKFNEVVKRYEKNTKNKPQISLEEGSFTIENEKAQMKIVIQEANVNNSYYYLNGYVFIHIM